MDINQIRQDTPHCTDKLFLNSAGSSLMPNVVVKKSYEYLLEEEKSGGYKVAALREEEINEFYAETAIMLNCRPENIAFCFNATDAYTKALSSFKFEKGEVILTTDDDYVSNHLNFLSLRNRYGIRIVTSGLLENGDLDLVDFEQKIIDYQPRLVAVTHIPTNSGLVQDVESVGLLCEKHDIYYLVDACQSVGQLPVDVQKIKCDFLSVTGRKFLRGPRGTGFLYVSDKILNSDIAPLYMDLRGAVWNKTDEFQISPTAKRFEIWEIPYPFVIGLKEAVKYANQIGIEEIASYNTLLRERLTANLSGINGLVQYDRGTQRSNIITVRKEGVSQDQTEKILNDHQVFFSISREDNARIDFEKKGVEWAVRLSPHYFNTLEEMDLIADVFKKM